MTQTIERTATERPAKNTTSASVHSRLPYSPLAFSAFQIDQGSWKALVEAIFPNAQSAESVILALSYCRARKLDPFKRNVHIVPIWDRERKCLVDTIWPGIGELRTTAFRTGEYAGRDATVFGEDLAEKVGNRDMTFPEWAQVTVYRMVKGNRVAFAGPRVYWLETYATFKRDDDSPNQMWTDRPRGQIDKCAEAAALRAAFPEEVGADYIAEEVSQRRTVESTVISERPQIPMPRAITSHTTTTTPPLQEQDQQQPPDENDGAPAPSATPTADHSASASTAGEAPAPSTSEPPKIPEMPNPCTEAWMIDWAIQKAPSWMTAADVKSQWKTKLTKAWDKMDRGTQEKFFARINVNDMKWQPPTAK